MQRLRRVVYNTLISLGGQVITWTSTLLLTIAYGRFLGDVKFGELYFAITLALLVGFPMEQGFNQQLTRDVAQEPSRAVRYLANTLLIKAVAWGLLYGLLLLIPWLLHYDHEVRLLVMISGLTLLWTGMGTAFAAAHYAFERNVAPVVGTILEKASSALLGYLFLKNGAGVMAMAWILCGGALLNMLWQALCFFRWVGFRPLWDGRTIRLLLRSSLPFLIYGVLGVLYYRLDVILLSFLGNDAMVGWYGAGYRLFDTLNFLPSLVIAAIMYPVFSKLAVQSQDALRLAIEKSLNFLLFCSIPTATLMVVAAPNIIGFLYHRPEFIHTFAVLQLLAPGLVFLYVNMVLSTVLVSIHQERKMTLMAGVALVFNLSLNLLLIPLYQQNGAALVTSLTELLFIGPFLGFIPRALWPRASLVVALKALGASLVMALVVWLLRSWSILALTPVAIAVYLAAATVLRTIPRSDLRTLIEAVLHRRGGSGEEPAAGVLLAPEAVVEAEGERQNQGEAVAGAGEAIVPAQDDEETDRLPVVRRLAKGAEAGQASLKAVVEAESGRQNQGEAVAGAGEAIVPAQDDEETDRLPVVRRLAEGAEVGQASLKLLS
ncbi:flippase [Thermogemmatispora carboxidivorans]|uniref:flippase n=1 Tax=Thermogemmatispora carboxidivorans TaxID=1382306 RepID=UPI0006997E2E|nr:flippase [Thermogemmatispora carboxidivorans]